MTTTDSVSFSICAACPPLGLQLDKRAFDVGLQEDTTGEHLWSYMKLVQKSMPGTGLGDTMRPDGRYIG